ncbi:MAG: hypothetical protein AAB019_00065 [Planctomycetota bacterium]
MKLMHKVNKVEIFGDTYYLRKPFDIVGTDLSVYGYDVSDDKGNFLIHDDIKNPDTVVSAISWDIYRVLR